MLVAYYQIMFYLSLFLALVYIFIWRKTLDIHITLMFILVPVTNFGYAMLALAESFDAAMFANKLTYSGCFLTLNIMLCIFSLCDINLPRLAKAFFLILSSAVFVIAVRAKVGGLFYKSIYYRRVNGMIVMDKQYGILHTLFYLMIITYFLLSMGAIAYSYLNKNQVSRKIIHLLFIPEALCFACFFLSKPLFGDMALVPAAYDISLLFFLLIVDRISLYNITDTAIVSMVQSGDTGFVSIDFDYNYLGSNETAKKMMPALVGLTVDKPMGYTTTMKNTVIKWLDDFREDDRKDTVLYEKQGLTYLINITYLYNRKRKGGYQLLIKDDTKNQEYIKLINSFNTELQKEVDAKTEHIIDIQNKMVLGMATMVESRDNSTGGHIKRTRDVVHIIINELRKNNIYDLPEEYFKNVIKAAPMHDLGKIAVDDAILRKPGRFIPEEFEQMKSHAAKGAKIVHNILLGTDDNDFRRIAENVAHYHHERWDGKGYPEGLKGKQIPLEARIMAIADVYDALASKRAYKEGMSYEEINKLILDGMGTQFDKSLEPYYLRARQWIEDYYDRTEH
ncbi:MAG: HD domain-containing protein [Firmicutes bacterium]|nr:HD domain-containing protein [Bacillota bacterium]